MSLFTLSAVSSRFSAARHLDCLSPGHPYRGLHGHNFLASVRANLPAASPEGTLDPVAFMRERLEQSVAPFNPGLLNDTLPQPDDLRLAQWLATATDVPGRVAVHLQSTAQQGVEWDIARGQAVAWRRYAFQAAHQLPRVPPGHKCGRMHGHGFSLVLTLALRADNLAFEAYDQMDAVWKAWQPQLDGACLNDLPGLENPTSEMLASWLWGKLKPMLPELLRVTVYETATCGAHFDGQSYRIWKDFSMDCAVRSRPARQNGEGRGITGYTFVLRLILAAPLDQVMGWTLDYGDVKRLFGPIYLDLDHRPLYEMAALAEGNNRDLAAWIFRAARDQLPSVDALALFETPGCGTWVSAGDWRGIPVGTLG